MAVCRIQKTSNYTVMSNHHLKDKRLSLKAKGLLSQMLSLPEDWNYTTEGLSEINKEGIASIKAAVNELEEAGYIIRVQPTDASGRFLPIEYHIFEEPQKTATISKPTENREVSPIVENRLTVKNYEEIPLIKNEVSAADEEEKSPLVDFPPADNPPAENCKQLNTNKSKTNNITIDIIYPEDKEEINNINNPARTCEDSGAPPGKQEEQEKRPYTHEADFYAMAQKIRYPEYYDYAYEKAIARSIIEVMIDIEYSVAPFIRINNSNIPIDTVKRRFRQLTEYEVQGIITRMGMHSIEDIRNMRNYLITALYNAPATAGMERALTPIAFAAPTEDTG